MDPPEHLVVDGSEQLYATPAGGAADRATSNGGDAGRAAELFAASTSRVPCTRSSVTPTVRSTFGASLPLGSPGMPPKGQSLQLGAQVVPGIITFPSSGHTQSTSPASTRATPVAQPAASTPNAHRSNPASNLSTATACGGVKEAKVNAGENSVTVAPPEPEPDVPSRVPAATVTDGGEAAAAVPTSKPPASFPKPRSAVQAVDIGTEKPIPGVIAHHRLRATSKPYMVFELHCRCGVKRMADRRAHMATFLKAHAPHFPEWAGITADSVNWSAVAHNALPRTRAPRRPSPGTAAARNPPKPVKKLVRLTPGDWHKLALNAVRTRDFRKDFLLSVIMKRTAQSYGKTIIIAPPTRC